MPAPPGRLRRWGILREAARPDLEEDAAVNNRLCLSECFILHQGTLPDTGIHAHGALILLVAAGRPLRVTLGDGVGYDCSSTLIDAGVQHRLVSHGEPFVSLHIEVTSRLGRYLRRRYLNGRPTVTDVLPAEARRRVLTGEVEIGDFPALFPFSEGEAPPLDRRIARSLGPVAQNAPLASVASLSRLSESRFSHLFASEMGLPFRHYRSWLQARIFVLTLPRHRSLTTHALDTGFYDSAHLSNRFQKLVGLSPRVVLANHPNVLRHESS